MRILIASVTNKAPEILEPHLKSILRQRLPEYVEVGYFYVLDPEIPAESKTLLDTFLIPWELCVPRPNTAEYSVSETTHHWSMDTFYWLGAQKQGLLEHAEDNGYDKIFLVDSDLVLGPETLETLVEDNRRIVSAVFWTQWQPDAPPLPQVWLNHPYEMEGHGLEVHEHMFKAANRDLWKVGGLGACTLIDTTVISKGVRYWPPMPELPSDSMWQGEDRVFSISAQQAHVKLWADSWPDIFHIYRPSDVAYANGMYSQLQRDEPKIPQIGDLINAKIYPIEEEKLKNWHYTLRGRLGTLKLVPELEDALGTMEVGTDSFVKIKFPVWYKIPEYRNQTKTMRIQLLGCKEFRYAPGLS